MCPGEPTFPILLILSLTPGAWKALFRQTEPQTMPTADGITECLACTPLGTLLCLSHILGHGMMWCNWELTKLECVLFYDNIGENRKGNRERTLSSLPQTPWVTGSLNPHLERLATFPGHQ